MKKLFVLFTALLLSASVLAQGGKILKDPGIGN